MIISILQRMKLRFREDDHLPKVTQQGRAEMDLNPEFKSIMAAFPNTHQKNLKNLFHNVSIQ